MRKGLALVAALALSPLALANTYIVDASGGGQFTDLPAAIAFASPGDVLLVMPGNYSGFTLDKRLTILGTGANAVIPNDFVTVQNIGTGPATVLAGMHTEFILVLNCTRPVILDSLTSDEGIDCRFCTDVRVARSTCGVMSSSFQSSRPGVFSSTSRIEISDSTVRGSFGGDARGWGNTGGNGLPAASGYATDFHAYRSSFFGGDGGDGNNNGSAGNGGTGGDGIELLKLNPTSPSAATIAGIATNFIHGGAGGIDGNDQNYAADGLDIHLEGDVRVSSVTFSSIAATNVQTPIPADPSLSTIGVPHQGQPLMFRVDAAPGSTVDLILGRNAIITAVPGLAEDQLVVQQRILHLGVVGPSGALVFTFPVSASLPKGFTFFGQARVTFAPGDVRFTNSTPLIVR